MKKHVALLSLMSLASGAYGAESQIDLSAPDSRRTLSQECSIIVRFARPSSALYQFVSSEGRNAKVLCEFTPKMHQRHKNCCLLISCLSNIFAGWIGS